VKVLCEEGYDFLFNPLPDLGVSLVSFWFVSFRSNTLVAFSNDADHLPIMQTELLRTSVLTRRHIIDAAVLALQVIRCREINVKVPCERGYDFFFNPLLVGSNSNYKFCTSLIELGIGKSST